MGLRTSGGLGDLLGSLRLGGRLGRFFLPRVDDDSELGEELELEGGLFFALSLPRLVDLPVGSSMAAAVVALRRAPSELDLPRERTP